MAQSYDFCADSDPRSVAIAKIIVSLLRNINRYVRLHRFGPKISPHQFRRCGGAEGTDHYTEKRHRRRKIGARLFVLRPPEGWAKPLRHASLPRPSIASTPHRRERPAMRAKAVWPSTKGGRTTSMSSTRRRTTRSTTFANSSSRCKFRRRWGATRCLSSTRCTCSRRRPSMRFSKPRGTARTRHLHLGHHREAQDPAHHPLALSDL